MRVAEEGWVVKDRTLGLFLFVAIVWAFAGFMWGRVSAEPNCVEDAYYHVQSGRCVHVDEIRQNVCGPDRCQSAQQACEAVRRHAAGVHADVAKGEVDGIPVEFGYLADEFVEAACGY